MDRTETIVAKTTAAISPGIPIWLVILLPFLFVIVFGGIWCFGSWLSSRVGGWNKVAKTYYCKELPKGQPKTVNGYIGWWNMRFAQFMIHASDEGMYIRMSLVSSFGYKPLFIPWGELHSVKPSNSIMVPRVQLQIGRPSQGTIAIPKTFYEEMVKPKLSLKEVQARGVSSETK